MFFRSPYFFWGFRIPNGQDMHVVGRRSMPWVQGTACVGRLKGFICCFWYVESIFFATSGCRRGCKKYAKSNGPIKTVLGWNLTITSHWKQCARGQISPLSRGRVNKSRDFQDWLLECTKNRQVSTPIIILNPPTSFGLVPSVFAGRLKIWLTLS